MWSNGYIGFRIFYDLFDNSLINIWFIDLVNELVLEIW